MEAWKTYSEGGRLLRKKWGDNWGPECQQFVNMLAFLKNGRGVSEKELLLCFYYLAEPQFWMVDPPWKFSKLRFYLEQMMTWLRVYKMLERSNSRNEFLDSMGLIEEEANALVPRRVRLTRKQFPAIADRFNKRELLDKVVLTTKPLVPKVITRRFQK